MMQASSSMVMQPIDGAFPNALLVPQGGFAHVPPIRIGRPLTLIGSDQQMHVRLRSQTVSPVHAVLLNSDGRVLLRDLASRTHVYVNRQRIRERILRPDDEIIIGKIRLKFVAGKMGQRPQPPLPQNPQLVYRNGTERPLSKRLNVIGSWQGADLVVTDPATANVQALAFFLGPHLFIRDLGGDGKTRVNGQEIAQTQLMPGDAVQIGEKTLFCKDVTESAGAVLTVEPQASPIGQMHAKSCDAGSTQGNVAEFSHVSGSAVGTILPARDRVVSLPLGKPARSDNSLDSFRPDDCAQRKPDGAELTKLVDVGAPTHDLLAAVAKPVIHALDPIITQVDNADAVPMASPPRVGTTTSHTGFEARVMGWGPLAIALAAREQPRLIRDNRNALQQNDSMRSSLIGISLIFALVCLVASICVFVWHRI